MLLDSLNKVSLVPKCKKNVFILEENNMVNPQKGLKGPFSPIKDSSKCMALKMPEEKKLPIIFGPLWAVHPNLF